MLFRWFISLVLVGQLSVPAALAGDGLSVEERRFWFSVVEEYRLRAAGAGGAGGLGGDSEQDQDLRLFGVGGWGDRQDRFAAGASGALWLDLDRGRRRDATALGSIRGGRVWADLYDGWAEYHSRGWLREVRVGRQSAGFGVPVTFDGAHARFRPVPVVDLFVFGGRTWHFFQTAADSRDDWMASGGLSLLPVEGLRVDLDYRFTREDTGGLEGWIDHSYGGQLWYGPWSWLHLKALARGLGDELANVGVHSRLEFDRIGAGARLGGESQTVKLLELNEVGDPFYRVLGPSLPHTRWEAALWKSFDGGERGSYLVEAGWQQRLVHGEESAFNREHGRAWLLFSGEDVGVAGPFVQAAAELHMAGPGDGWNDEGLVTAGGAVGYRNRAVRAEAGSWYQRFKYEYYREVREVEGVRTVYGAVRWRVVEWLTVAARYEYERLAERDLHSVRLTLTQGL